MVPSRSQLRAIGARAASRLEPAASWDLAASQRAVSIRPVVWAIQAVD